MAGSAACAALAGLARLREALIRLACLREALIRLGRLRRGWPGWRACARR